MREKKKNKIEKYIRENNLENKKIADVLRAYERGHNNLGEITCYYGYNIDLAVMHLTASGEI
jgi:hypothetical protein